MKTGLIHDEYKTRNARVGCWLLFALLVVVCLFVVGVVVCCLLIAGRCCLMCVVALLFCEH